MIKPTPASALHLKHVQVNTRISSITSIPSTKETSEQTIINTPLALNLLLYCSARSKSENRSSSCMRQNYLNLQQVPANDGTSFADLAQKVLPI